MGFSIEGHVPRPLQTARSCVQVDLETTSQQHKCYFHEEHDTLLSPSGGLRLECHAQRGARRTSYVAHSPDRERTGGREYTRTPPLTPFPTYRSASHTAHSRSRGPAGKGSTRAPPPPPLPMLHRSLPISRDQEGNTAASANATCLLGGGEGLLSLELLFIFRCRA